MRKTKIICTIGPACNNEKTMEQMLKAGMNIARLNFSHGTHEMHRENIEMFRRVRDSLGLPAAVMLDTKGPEIRLGKFGGDGTATLKRGGTFTLTTKEIEGDACRASITYKNLPSDVKVGDRLLIDDGRILMEVESISDTDIVCHVIDGGVVSSRKGINAPNIKLNMPYLSDRDKDDIRFGIAMDVDFVAASFARRADDIIALRKYMDYHGGHKIRIIAKIENTEGIENFDEILKYSDGIMVARGDMGVEIEYERLPGLQKKFIKKCYQSGKMVITATQMLESMIHSSTPTRAEITDVANAVFDGTSAVMLSGETAIGDHPAKVVRVMARIARQAEMDALELDSYSGIIYDTDDHNLSNAICDAACTTARDVNAKAILAVTKSGITARGISKYRPAQPIIAATPEVKTFHQLSLSWGVAPVLALSQDSEEKLFRHAIDCAKQIDMVHKGDKVVITAGLPLNQAGSTNLLKVQIVE